MLVCPFSFTEIFNSISTVIVTYYFSATNSVKTQKNSRNHFKNHEMLITFAALNKRA